MHTHFLQQDSELLGSYNHFMHNLRESGVLRKIVAKHFGADSDEVHIHHGTATAVVLGYDNLFFPIFVALVGLLVALGVLMGEVAAVCWHRKKSKARDSA